MNSVMLAGNLGADPEMRFTATGKKVANFRVAVEDRYKSGDGYTSTTDWFAVVAWERLADVAGGLVKGDRVIVVGKLKTRSWDDPTTGKRRTVVEVVAAKLGFEPLRQVADDVAPKAPSTSARPAPAPPDDPGYFDDDVPF